MPYTSINLKGKYSLVAILEGFGNFGVNKTITRKLFYTSITLQKYCIHIQGIPTGFCYQRLMLFDTLEIGYCIHALNAVFLESIDKWIRLDTRGNKPVIDAQFSIDEEMLAFTVQEELDEEDYPIIYVEPHHKTISTLENHTNALEMYKYHLPETL